MRHEPIVSPAALDSGVQSHEWMVDSARLALRKALVDRQFGRAAVVSSFGAESAVLLHLVAGISSDTPVLFVDTQMMFQETLDYQLELSAKLGLTDVRRISQKTEMLRREDVFGRLHLKDTDACCHLRKKLPLDEALARVVIDVSGRPFLSFEAPMPEPVIGSDFAASLVEEFWRALVMNAGLTCHIDLLRARNSHHAAEAIFKAGALALRDATRLTGMPGAVPSTKGLLA